MKKKWYDYLWIVTLVYLVLGFFNILFAWLGLLCFFIPLIISVATGTKGYCNRYCGRSQLFGLLGGVTLHRFVILTVEVDAVMFGRDIEPLSFVYAFALTILFSTIVNLVMGRKLKRVSMVESMKAPE